MTQIQLITVLLSIFLWVAISEGAVVQGDGDKSTPRLKTYYHDETLLAQQAEAIAHYCPQVVQSGARLVTPLIETDVQRLKEYLILHGLTTTQILTSGAKFNNEEYEWLYTLDHIPSTVLHYHPNCTTTSAPSTALCFQADSLTVYGFCECDFTVTFKFVCELET